MRAMNNTQIMKQAIDLLEQISEDPDYFAQEIGPIDGALVVQTLSALFQQTATIQTETQLLMLCDTIHKLVEEVPALRELLLAPQTNVTETQEYRAVTIKLCHTPPSHNGILNGGNPAGTSPTIATSSAHPNPNTAIVITNTTTMVTRISSVSAELSVSNVS